jgi:6-pyruvoyltetrahydropterin/6-carboxytetrahydropterin synthase
MDGTFLTSSFDFCAAHRLMGYPGKCVRLHGHNYHLEIEVWTHKIGDDGMVIDAARLKQIVGTWIESHWDHGAILQAGDPLIHALREIPAQKICDIKNTPTAENLALLLADEVLPKLLASTTCFCTRVSLWETPKVMAEVRRTFPRKPNPNRPEKAERNKELLETAKEKGRRP